MPRRRTTKWLEAARRRDRAPSPGEAGDWIGRALPRAGVLAFDDAERAIRAGRVVLNGRVVREPFTSVRAGDVVQLDGRAVSLSGETLCLAFHKPAGVVTSTVDAHGAGTVFERLSAVLPPELRGYGWHAMGRLDRDTTGLLLFTNDERLVEHVTSPKTHLPKRYVAEVHGTATGESLDTLRRGVELDDGRARPARVRVVDDGRAVELTLTEGRHHQVKRMLGAVGLPVKALRREAVGAVELGALPAGAMRILTQHEIEAGLQFPPRSF